MMLLNLLGTANSFLGKACTGLEIAGTLLNGTKALVNRLRDQMVDYEVLPKYTKYQIEGYGFPQQPATQPIMLQPIFVQPQPYYFYNCGQMQPQSPHFPYCGQMQPNVNQNYEMQPVPQNYYPQNTYQRFF